MAAEAGVDARRDLDEHEHSDDDSSNDSSEGDAFSAEAATSANGSKGPGPSSADGSRTMYDVGGFIVEGESMDDVGLVGCHATRWARNLEPDRPPFRGSPSGSIFVQAEDNFDFGMLLARCAHASPRTLSNPNVASSIAPRAPTPPTVSIACCSQVPLTRMHRRSQSDAAQRRLGTGAWVQVSGPRALQPSQWGMLCPCDTPEGEPCGLIKHLAMLSHITVDTDASRIEDVCTSLGVIPAELINGEELYCKGFMVFMNGLIIGVHREVARFARECV